jgi:hypothetical protein
MYSYVVFGDFLCPVDDATFAVVFCAFNAVDSLLLRRFVNLPVRVEDGCWLPPEGTSPLGHEEASRWATNDMVVLVQGTEYNSNTILPQL